MNFITDRILEILKDKALTPSSFADTIGIQRSSMSHILSGRNKPSLDVIHKILITYPEIHSDWLLTGKGPMKQLNLFGEVEKTEPKIENEDDKADNKTETGVRKAELEEGGKGNGQRLKVEKKAAKVEKEMALSVMNETVSHSEDSSNNLHFFTNQYIEPVKEKIELPKEISDFQLFGNQNIEQVLEKTELPKEISSEDEAPTKYSPDLESFTTHDIEQILEKTEQLIKLLPEVEAHSDNKSAFQSFTNQDIEQVLEKTELSNEIFPEAEAHAEETFGLHSFTNQDIEQIFERSEQSEDIFPEIEALFDDISDPDIEHAIENSDLANDISSEITPFENIPDIQSLTDQTIEQVLEKSDLAKELSVVEASSEIIPEIQSFVGQTVEQVLEEPDLSTEMPAEVETPAENIQAFQDLVNKKIQPASEKKEISEAADQREILTNEIDTNEKETNPLSASQNIFKEFEEPSIQEAKEIVMITEPINEPVPTIPTNFTIAGEPILNAQPVSEAKPVQKPKKLQKILMFYDDGTFSTHLPE